MRQLGFALLKAIEITKETTQQTSAAQEEETENKLFSKNSKWNWVAWKFCGSDVQGSPGI